MDAQEYANLLQKGENPIAKEIGKGTPKVRRFVNRKFMLTPYRQRIVRGRVYSKRMESVIVTSNLKAKKISELKRMGYGRVDSVEIETTVNEKISTMNIVAMNERKYDNKYTVKATQEIASRKMEFAQQIFAAANNKAIPKAIETVIPGPTQTTIAWELIDNQPNAFLDNRPIVKVRDRQNANRAERKRNQLFNKMNSEQVDKMMIFHKASGMPMFSSTEEYEIANYIEENSLSLEDIVLYVPNDVYWALKGMEE